MLAPINKQDAQMADFAKNIQITTQLLVLLAIIVFVEMVILTLIKYHAQLGDMLLLMLFAPQILNARVVLRENTACLGLLRPLNAL